MADAYDDAVRRLAAWHAEGMKPKVTVYAIPDPRRREVRLVEVSRAFPESRDPAPVTIGPTREFPFISSTVSISPVELRLVKAGELPLPNGWDFSLGRKVWPGDAA